MRTKWHKYPKEIPHEIGFYLVKGTDKDGKEFEDDAYWDGNTFRCWNIESEIYNSHEETIKKWAEKSIKYQMVLNRAKNRQEGCRGYCAECVDYARYAEYVTGDWVDFKVFTPYVEEEDDDYGIEWENYDN